MKHSTRTIFYFVCTILLFGNVASAQSIVRSVISSGGNYSSNSNGALYANVGELQINNFPTTGYYLTEGFVQPEIYLPVFVPSNDVQSSDVSIFPNPSTGNISVISSADKISSVEIFDTQGRKVYEDKSGTTASNQKLTLNITELNNGVYFIKVITSKSSVSMIRFVKM